MRLLRTFAGAAFVVLVFLWGLPQIADFREVWAAITDMSWPEVATLLTTAAWNIATYMFVAMAVLPGLSFAQAFVVGQSSTAVATALPAGSALGIGVTYAMYSAWGRSGPEIGLAAVVSGLWNTFVKLALPIVALALLALSGSADGSDVVAALFGLAVLVAAVFVFWLMLRSDALAQHVGERLQRGVSGARRAVRMQPVSGWGERMVRFRADTVELLRTRWRVLTAATVVSHLSLFAVLLLALRHVGVTPQQITWIEALSGFSFIRLVTALPVTPGGLGLVELGLVAVLVLAGGSQAPVVAAVLVFRFLTLIVQVPVGAISYAGWRAHMRRSAKAVAPRVVDHVTV
jgi:uncharacterized protein (TIRG00374 family)